MCAPHKGIVNTFDGYEKALKNTLLNKLAIESPDHKFEDITLKDGRQGLTYSWHSITLRQISIPHRSLIIGMRMRLQMNHYHAQLLNATNIKQRRWPN